MASLKTILDNARSALLRGDYPKTVLATNAKTGVTILDNVPQLTCYGACPIRDKCYDVKILKLRPNVARCRALRHYLIQHNPSAYTDKAIAEIRKGGYSQVRVYGGGDFAPAHVNILVNVMRACPDVKFYMISKTIRTSVMSALILLAYENFFLNISECKDFYFGPEWDDIRTHPRVNSVYTLLEDDIDMARARVSDIVFNVSKKAANIKLYKDKGLPLCPCDSHDIPAKGACGDCRLCSVKGGVKLNLGVK